MAKVLTAAGACKRRATLLVEWLEDRSLLSGVRPALIQSIVPEQTAPEPAPAAPAPESPAAAEETILTVSPSQPKVATNPVATRDEVATRDDRHAAAPVPAPAPAPAPTPAASDPTATDHQPSALTPKQTPDADSTDRTPTRPATRPAHEQPSPATPTGSASPAQPTLKTRAVAIREDNDPATPTPAPAPAPKPAPTPAPKPTPVDVTDAVAVDDERRVPPTTKETDTDAAPRLADDAAVPTSTPAAVSDVPPRSAPEIAPAPSPAGEADPLVPVPGQAATAAADAEPGVAPIVPVNPPGDERGALTAESGDLRAAFVPEVAGLWGASPAVDLSSLDLALAAFLNSLEDFSCQLLQGRGAAGWPIWLTAVTLAAGACEVGRRQMRRNPTEIGKETGPLRWTLGPGV